MRFYRKVDSLVLRKHVAYFRAHLLLTFKCRLTTDTQGRQTEGTEATCVVQKPTNVKYYFLKVNRRLTIESSKQLSVY